MKIIKFTFSILAIALGVFMVVYGGIDDSPGAQLLGFLMLLAGTVGLIKRAKRQSE